MNERLTYLMEHLEMAVDDLRTCAAKDDPQIADVLEGVVGVRNWTTDIIQWCAEKARGEP